MKTILLSGFAASALIIAGSSAGASDSRVVATEALAAEALSPVANGRKPGAHVASPGVYRVGGPRHGRSLMIFRPRPGMHGIPRHDIYRRPFRGFVMPRYWVQPSFLVRNYTFYGLSTPSNGFNWSRYYDDAVLTDHRGYVQDYRPDVDWNEGDTEDGPNYGRPHHGPSMQADEQAYQLRDDGKVTFAGPDGSTYSYDGKWQGEFVDPEARVFQGEWQGTVTRHDGAGSAHPAPHPGEAPYPGGPVAGEDHDDYDLPEGYGEYERCLKSNGVKGAAIGAIIGGVAGNRIAGRGDRLGGTLLGAGLGGLAGVAIEKASAKCRQYEPRHSDRGGATVYSHGYQQQAYGWQGGDYYQQAPMVTVTVVPGGAHTTTTVTEEVYYETVRKAPRKKAVRKWKPKPKPRCICR